MVQNRSITNHHVPTVENSSHSWLDLEVQNHSYRQSWVRAEINDVAESLLALGEVELYNRLKTLVTLLY